MLHHFNVYSLILGLLSFNSLCKYLIYIDRYYFFSFQKESCDIHSQIRHFFAYAALLPFQEGSTYSEVLPMF